jgi:hypothetical protein
VSKHEAEKQQRVAPSGSLLASDANRSVAAEAKHLRATL